MVSLLAGTRDDPRINTKLHETLFVELREISWIVRLVVEPKQGNYSSAGKLDTQKLLCYFRASLFP